MRTSLIACAMLEDELKRAIEETGCTLPVHWIDRGLHNTPSRLRAEVQAVIDTLTPTSDTILMAYGLCGGAMEGLVSTGARLVFPLFHDCIQMLLFGADGENHKENDILYFTRGWTQDEQFIGNEYARFCARRGEKKARMAYRAMLSGYRSVCLVDTGCYELPPAMDKLRPVAQLLDLDCCVQPGSTEILKELLTGRWEKHFYILAPGHPLSMVEFLERSAALTGYDGTPVGIPQPGG